MNVANRPEAMELLHSHLGNVKVLGFQIWSINIGKSIYGRLSRSVTDTHTVHN